MHYVVKTVLLWCFQTIGTKRLHTLVSVQHTRTIQSIRGVFSLALLLQNLLALYHARLNTSI